MFPGMDRTAPHLFQPGKTGNPKGRPTLPFDVREMARAHTTTAIATLVFHARRKSNPSAAVRAAEILLDRGWGKATQVVDARISVIDQMSDAEQRSLLAALRQLAANEALADQIVGASVLDEDGIGAGARTTH